MVDDLKVEVFKLSAVIATITKLYGGIHSNLFKQMTSPGNSANYCPLISKNNILSPRNAKLIYGTRDV